MNDDAIAAASEIAATFELLEVPYMIGGSMASTLWGEPRFTRNVDLVAALRSKHVAPLISRLGEDWYAEPGDIREAISNRASFNLIRLKRMVKVDIFVPTETGLDESKWKRIRREVLDPESGQELCITSPEDIVLQKLDWFRRGGEVSDNSWRDVTSLLRIQGERLDDEYLESWAARMELSELLVRARNAE